MGCTDVPRAVFIETNLGTRLAVPASPDITAENFKREVERMHLNCFPELGNVTVNAMMVKQNLHCYHLSGSLPLKYAFLGSNFTWFLQTRINLVESLKYEDTKVHNLSSAANVVADSAEMGTFVLSSCEKITKCKRKKVNLQRFPYLKTSMLKIFAALCCLKRRKRKNLHRKRKIGNPIRDSLQRYPSKKQGTYVVTEAISEAISEPASVSGIIKKYFSDYDEVASSPECFPTTARYRHEKPSSGNKKADVGKRLLLASDSLGLTPSNCRSILSLCRGNGGESQLHKFPATLRNIVFDITDNGD